MKLTFLAFVLSWFALLSCNQDESKLDIYLESLSKEIDSDKLEEFKSCKIDKEGKILDLITFEVRPSMNNLSKQDYISQYLDSISDVEMVRADFVILALHYHCNNKPIDVETIKNKLQIIYDYKKTAYLDEDDIRWNRIARKNDNLYSVGDTISAAFRRDDLLSGFGFSYNPWVTDSVYFRFDDLIKISGILQKKSYEPWLDNTIDSNKVIFNIKLLKISNSNFIYDESYLNVGDNVKIYVNSYGRLLGNIEDYDKW
jgi:hypothetical protein